MSRFKSASALAGEAQDILKHAQDEGRELTADERGKIDGLIEVSRQRKADEEMQAEVKAMSDDLGRPTARRGDGLSIDGLTGGSAAEFSQGGMSNAGPGDVFVQSEGYKRIADSASRGQTWTSGGVEVPLETKTTLTTTPGTALTPAGYTPGIVSTLFQRLTLADLMPNQNAPGNPVRYVSESTATNAAAAVSEGAAKPESTLQFSEVSEPVRKLATFLPVSDEMLEDAPQIQAYLNGRLQLFVKIQEEAQLLTGNGTAPNIQGFVGTGRAIGTFTRNAGTTNELALLKAMNGTRGSSFLDPDAIIIHPNNWLPIRAGTDTTGQYLGGGPFLGSYGNQAQASASQFASDNLWGVRVYVTSAIPAGTALVGCFGQAATVYRKGGLTVEASNAHSTFFQSNLIALRAEERLALAVFRPSAFTAVVNLA